MRLQASEKLEVIRLVEGSELSARRTLKELGVPRSTFYSWYRRYTEAGRVGLGARNPAPYSASTIQQTTAWIHGTRDISATRCSPGDRNAVANGSAKSRSFSLRHVSSARKKAMNSAVRLMRCLGINTENKTNARSLYTRGGLASQAGLTEQPAAPLSSWNQWPSGWPPSKANAA